MKKLLAILAACAMALGLTACASTPKETTTTPTPEESTTPVVESFSAEYDIVGTTSAGKPKNDTFIFEGKTTDGIITELNFDIIRNKGLEGEYSKKDIMGYLMNISDAAVTKIGDGYELTNLGINGYETKFGQYMITAVCKDLTEASTFKDLTITNYTGEQLSMEDSLMIYQYLANEAKIQLTEDTPLKDLLAIFDLYKDGAFVEGTKRVSFAGFNGGRSYGEQIDAIADYILANNMTLEDVYEMFKTVNQQSEPIEERDTITGATIAFVGDFQRMVYMAIHGELFEGVTTHSTAEGVTKVEVVTQGYAGEIETHVSFDDSTKKITAITVRDDQETDTVGGLLTAEGSEFIQKLIDNQDALDSVDAVAGATLTSNGLVKAVQFAVEYYNGL